MIVLCKNFVVYPYNYINVSPVAIVEKNSLEVIVDENKKVLFPNNGKVFTPSIYQEASKGNFMIYELEPSARYSKEIENSRYYMIKQIIKDATLLEVYFLKEDYETEVDGIIKKIRFGFSNKVEMLPEILFKTTDNYLLGPFKTEYDQSKQLVRLINDFENVKYTIPVYSISEEQMLITTYYDEFDDIERHFSLNYPYDLKVIDEIDIAPEDYIIREAIRFLKGTEEFGDITRRITRGINDWIKDATFSKGYNTKRLRSAVDLLREISPEIELDSYKDYSQQLLSLPSFKEQIEKATEQKFQQEYEKFESENRALIIGNDKLQTEEMCIRDNIKVEESKLSKLNEDIEKYIQFMNDKIESMDEVVLEQYFQKLVGNKVSNKNESVQVTFIEKSDSALEFKEHNDIDSIRKDLKHNLKRFEERDIDNVILDYCSFAIKFNQPLIIVGRSSFVLADIIQKTFSARQNQSIIPDMQSFNLHILEEVKNRQATHLNFTMIHNVHVSNVSLNLTGFINGYSIQSSNNKIIFTFDSFEESRFILEQFKSYLILDISHKTFSPSPFENYEPLNFGQIENRILVESIQPILNFQESFEELVEVIEDMEEVVVSNDKLEKELKSTFKKLVYVNQVLSKSEKSIKYFPFLITQLSGNSND